MKKQWMGLLACLAIDQVQAASFDCAKAGTKVERLIFANQELSKPDEALFEVTTKGDCRHEAGNNDEALDAGHSLMVLEGGMRDG